MTVSLAWPGPVKRIFSGFRSPYTKPRPCTLSKANKIFEGRKTARQAGRQAGRPEGGRTGRKKEREDGYGRNIGR
jgi:hypothetical protein